MEKTKFILFLYLFGMSTTFGQNLKTYNGIYSDGIAKYTYYLNEDMTRNFEGQFDWKSKENPQFKIFGKFKNNIKVGLWNSNYGGIKEIINFNNYGLKNGKYTLNYKNEGEFINIDANMLNGEIDTLSFFSSDKELGIIRGNISKNKGLEIWLRRWDQYEMQQYYYKEVYLGSIIIDITTGDASESIENIKKLENLVSQVDWDSFEIGGEYYKIVPLKQATILGDQDSYNVNDIGNYLRSRPLFFLYDFHLSAWPIDLSRGEVFNEDYIVCYTIVKDYEKNEEIQREKKKKEWAEIQNTIKLNQEKERQESERLKKINDFKIKFLQTEYGRTIEYMKQFIDLPDNEYKIERNKYFVSLLSKVSSELYNSDIDEEVNQKTIQIKYTRELPYYKDEIFQNYIINSPFQLKKYNVIIVPTKLALKGGNLCIAQATIFYLYNPDRSLKLYLQYYNSEVIIRDMQNIKNNGNSRFYFIKDGNNYKAEYNEEKYIFKPISDFNGKNQGCYYEIWTNTDIDSPDKLSKKEVSRTIEDRFDSSN
ncbi:MAG: hypothetical protein PHN41_06125 [Bacteroidales bacterium]|nr:hypothetical protein [Bacteroidales bacterium]